jgi:hypothetical protein
VATRRLLRVWVGLLLAYLVAALVAALVFGEFDEAFAFAGLPLFVLAHALHQLHVPWMLEHAGLCGWGPCAPTTTGMVAAAIVLAGALWVLACVLSWAWSRIARARG